jgi:hypothetical protein
MVLPAAHFGTDVDAESQDAEELGQNREPAAPQLILGIIDRCLVSDEDIRRRSGVQCLLRLFDRGDDVSQLDGPFGWVIPGRDVEEARHRVRHLLLAGLQDVETVDKAIG